MDFLLEIGCEEIPARFVKPLVEQLERGLCQFVEQQSLAGEEFRTENYATPRRLAVLARGMLESRPERTEVVYGPRYEAAYDAEGKPTKACMGFARSKGVDIDALEVFETERGKVVGVRMKTGGEPAGKVLAQHLPAIVAGLKVQKSMRWGDGSYQFVRPVHWICALAGSDVVEFEFAGIRSGRQSRGHRFTSPGPFEIGVPADYRSICERHGVMADRSGRRKLISDRLGELAVSVGGRPIQDEQLLEEVADLVEWPVAILGRFEQRFLRLPREVLVAAMRNHQRYFAIEDADGKLVNAFVAIANTPVEDEQPVRHGFERVLTARLNDAEFFFDQDRKTPPRQLVDKLDGMLFQAELGSYLEKSQRIEKLAVALAELVGKKDADFLERLKLACRLCKTDLLTEMVGEFPELHGIMGCEYARAAGEDEQVALAIREHVLPRGQGDGIPSSELGRLVALADRLDTLAGCFGVGLEPTASADPFGLRRQALGVIAIVTEGGMRLSLRRALELAVDGVYGKVEAARLEQARKKERRRAARKKEQPRQIDSVEPFAEELVDRLYLFVGGRLKQRLVEMFDTRPDIVESVLGVGFDDMYLARLRLEALCEFMGRPGFEDLAVAFKRVSSILKDFDDDGEPDTGMFELEEERALYETMQELKPQVDRLMEQARYLDCLELLGSRLRGPVDRFFDKVLVNDPQNPGQTRNRKSLLRKVESLFVRLADFGRLRTSGKL